MESTQIQALYEPPLAAMPQLREKPRQGFETRKTTSKPGSSSCNFTVTLGLQATVVENGVRETYSARYYNPATGRFMSRDPEDGKAVDPKTLHKYLYAGGNPVNMSDPMGHEALFENALIQGGSKLAVEDYVLSKAGLVVAGCFYGVARAIYALVQDQSFWPGADGAMALIGCATGWPLPPVT